MNLHLKRQQSHTLLKGNISNVYNVAHIFSMRLLILLLLLSLFCFVFYSNLLADDFACLKKK